jgi:hypothetical protein
VAERLGMNASLVRSLSHSISAQSEMLDHAQESLARAAMISQNPLRYMLSPGSLILAPFSIGLITSANADLTYARASAQELVQKLLAEASAQEFASSASYASYILGVAWRTPDAKRVPDVDPWDFLAGVVSPLRGVVDAITGVAGLIDSGLTLVKHYAADTWKKITTWWDDIPSWAKGLKKFGRALPWVGTGLTAMDLATELSKDDKNWWNIVRYGGSLVLDVASFIPPIAPFAAAGGIVWDLGWDAGERIYNFATHIPEMAAYYQEVPWMAPIHLIAPFTLDFWGPIAG